MSIDIQKLTTDANSAFEDCLSNNPDFLMSGAANIPVIDFTEKEPGILRGTVKTTHPAVALAMSNVLPRFAEIPPYSREDLPEKHEATRLIGAAFSQGTETHFDLQPIEAYMN